MKEKSGVKVAGIYHGVQYDVNLRFGELTKT